VIDPDILGGRLGNRLFQLAYLYGKVRDGVIPDWYVQDTKYFEKYQNEIKELFGEGIGYLPYVSVHLRRGDYVNNPFYCDLATTGYYINATNLFPNRKFMIFSDDMEFARMYFEGDKFIFDNSVDQIEAFNKGASCSDHIIANSSFSFWYAWLSPSVSKKVIAPKVESWYADGVERTVCPSDWIRL
jgi:hypothetical protein